GRITRNDVLAVVEGPRPSQPSPPATPPAPATPAAPAANDAPAAAPVAPGARPQAPPAPAPARAPVAPAKPGERDEVIPFSNIRRRTAEHMVRSKATSAHVLVVVETDFEAVDRVRSAVQER